MKPIPIEAGKRIADEFDYDQVVIVARRVGGGEHVTTYGRDEANCDVAARMGYFFKHKLMGWPDPAAPDLLAAMQQIAVGNWNFGNARPGLTVMQFAGEAVDKATKA